MLQSHVFKYLGRLALTKHRAVLGASRFLKSLAAGALRQRPDCQRAAIIDYHKAF